MNSIMTKAHKHKLTYKNTVKEGAKNGFTSWTCDACGRGSKELQQTHSYKCEKCDFDLCKECPQPIKTKKHAHSLAVTILKGSWTCDNCGTNSSRPGGGRLPWHCEEGCDFDLCFGCTRSHKSAAHRHLLLKSNPKKTYPNLDGWGCDICGEGYHHEDNEKPYECKKCEYDLCEKCMKETEVLETVENVQTKMEKSLAITDSGASPNTKGGQVPMVFISYQWDIQDKILKLKKTLESKNITCWMDTNKMMGGDDLKKEIDRGIRGCKIVVSCVTEAYSQSHACQQEVALADVLKKPILPVLFESVTWPPEGPMAMPFAPLIYINCEKGLTSENLDTIIKTIKSKTG
ncbi:zinc finger X-chromosomal protein-like isoform X1 [Dendronephthya gigantea]|uniref:zinc finger X-chromosomal protein-like isoform X1 n=1 Tax=Dendronephthya gigantea TaxID=151771 RepID=UPI00106CBE40|nr:zinc finger X-chromosomal protein-like isoform X1 [Dendronephthya gigantea]